MTTTEQTTALATREWTDAQLQTRIKANISARFGLQDATPPQLNIIFLLAKRWGLDPVNEITLYEGRPFITLDGRLQLMRRNPDYRGYRTRPLTRTEREDWGYEPDDIVVEAVVLTHHHGDITERGCVRRAEVDGARARAKESGKRAAPVGIYAPEIAEKRAIARASRAAFGQDVPDEDEVGYIIEEQNDPKRVALNAARYDEIMGSEATGTAFDGPDQHTAPVGKADRPARAEQREAPASDVAAAATEGERMYDVRSKPYQDYAKLCSEAIALEVDYEALTAPVAASVLAERHAALSEAVQAARDAAAQQEQAAF